MFLVNRFKMEGAEDWSNVYGIDLAQAQATTW